MAYTLKIFASEEVSEEDRSQAAQRFRATLATLLGDDDLVLSVHRVYLRLVHAHGEAPRPWPISAAEQVLVTQWEEAEQAATRAAFGAERYMGDAQYEIGS